MTKRIIRAMENPFITILAHPTGRLLLKREPYAIDIPAVLEAAAETGTWIELNAAPKRLDLDWRWWPLAKQKGVKCVINPDAHRTERSTRLNSSHTVISYAVFCLKKKKTKKRT